MLFDIRFEINQGGIFRMTGFVLWIMCQNRTEAEIPKCGRNAEKMREDNGIQKGRGFNLCVAPSPRNQVSRISDGAEKDLE